MKTTQQTQRSSSQQGDTSIVSEIEDAPPPPHTKPRCVFFLFLQVTFKPKVENSKLQGENRRVQCCGWAFPNGVLITSGSGFLFFTG